MIKCLSPSIIVLLNLIFTVNLWAKPMMTKGDASTEWGFQRVAMAKWDNGTLIRLEPADNSVTPKDP